MASNSEFTCEVVRIHSIRPHPNADRLELITIELKGSGVATYTTAYEKGALKVGDYMIYVSADSLVPIEGITAPDGRDVTAVWAFLKNNIRYKPGSQYFRIHAAKLRGIFSEGVLIPNGRGHKFGDQVADYLCVLPYVRPEAGTPGEANAPKVTSSLKRRLNALMPEFSVLSMKKVPFAIAEGTEVVLTEKIHGCNMRVGYHPVGPWGKYMMVIGSHRAFKTDLRSTWQRICDWFNRKIHPSKRHYYKQDLWTQTAIDYSLDVLVTDRSLKDYTLYFEMYGQTESGTKIQDMTYGTNELKLRLIGAYHAPSKMWSEFEHLRHLSKLVGVSTVPMLDRLPWGEAAREQMRTMAEDPSVLDGGIREGIVAHPYRAPAGPNAMKYVSQQYLMRAGQ